ncbi:hypothetical protein [Phenylobacterium sp.]|jgi:hypothetical protein|uniref:hypothetical protein n=1 Tax=Phenylobacterium sp. TaxID=1871053 RepID=UPI0037842008
MRAALPVMLALALGACATASPDGGIMSYDTLQRLQTECAAKGGKLTQKRGGDFQDLGNYACERN